MNMIKFSANLSTMFTELPFTDRFAAAKAAGFEAVELQYVFDEFPATEIRSRVQDLGLALNHINTRAGNPGETGLAAQTGRESEFAAIMDEALENARILDALTIHVMSGNVAPAEKPAARDTFLSNIEKASSDASGMKTTLCVEPINPVDRPDYFVSKSDDVVDLLTQINRPNVKLLFDFYHIQIAEGDLARRMDRHWDHIGHFQFAGVPDRHEPQNCEINFPVLFGEIAQRGWQGYAGAEYRPQGRTENGLAWLKLFQPS